MTASNIMVPDHESSKEGFEKASLNHDDQLAFVANSNTKSNNGNGAREDNMIDEREYTIHESKNTNVSCGDIIPVRCLDYSFSAKRDEVDNASRGDVSNITTVLASIPEIDSNVQTNNERDKKNVERDDIEIRKCQCADEFLSVDAAKIPSAINNFALNVQTSGCSILKSGREMLSKTCQERFVADDFQNNVKNESRETESINDLANAFDRSSPDTRDSYIISEKEDQHSILYSSDFKFQTDNNVTNNKKSGSSPSVLTEPYSGVKLLVSSVEDLYDELFQTSTEEKINRFESVSESMSQIYEEGPKIDVKTVRYDNEDLTGEQTIPTDERVYKKQDASILDKDKKENEFTIMTVLDAKVDEPVTTNTKKLENMIKSKSGEFSFDVDDESRVSRNSRGRRVIKSVTKLFSNKKKPKKNSKATQ